MGTIVLRTPVLYYIPLLRSTPYSHKTNNSVPGSPSSYQIRYSTTGRFI